MDESYDPKFFNQSSIAMIPPMVPVSYPNKIPPKAVGELDAEEDWRRENTVPANADMMAAHRMDWELTPPPAPPGPPPIASYVKAWGEKLLLQYQAQMEDKRRQSGGSELEKGKSFEQVPKVGGTVRKEAKPRRSQGKTQWREFFLPPLLIYEARHQSMWDAILVLFVCGGKSIGIYAEWS